jgi:predicted ATPase
MERFVVISGCSGGGKSTLLKELAKRDHDVIDEPGRRIVKNAFAAPKVSTTERADFIMSALNT